MTKKELMGGAAKKPQVSPGVSEVQLGEIDQETHAEFQVFKKKLAVNFLARINHTQYPVKGHAERSRVLLDMWSGAAMAFLVDEHVYGRLMMLQSHLVAQKGEPWIKLMAEG